MKKTSQCAAPDWSAHQPFCCLSASSSGHCCDKRSTTAQWRNGNSWSRNPPDKRNAKAQWRNGKRWKRNLLDALTARKHDNAHKKNYSTRYSEPTTATTNQREINAKSMRNQCENNADNLRNNSAATTNQREKVGTNLLSYFLF